MPKNKTEINKTSSNLSIPNFTVAGKKLGSITLPKNIFSSKPNSALLTQALRVYLNNQRSHWSNTKTRGEVKGSTRKLFRQKHTGRARHGSIKAPIFVGGGIALGPKSRKVTLSLPQKQKKTALLLALSQKASDKTILSITGLDKLSGKTSEVANVLKKVFENKKETPTLFVTAKKEDMLTRAVKNIPYAKSLPVDQLNAYEVIRYQNIILTKDAISKLEQKLC